MSLTEGQIAWFEDHGEATLCDMTGKLRARAELEDRVWVVYDGDEGIHLGGVRADLPPKVVHHMVEAMLIAAAEADWAISEP